MRCVEREQAKQELDNKDGKCLERVRSVVPVGRWGKRYVEEICIQTHLHVFGVYFIGGNFEGVNVMTAHTEKKRATQRCARFFYGVQ